MDFKTTKDSIIFYPKTQFDIFNLGEIASNIGQYEADIEIDKNGNHNVLKSVDFDKKVFLDYLFTPKSIKR